MRRFPFLILVTAVLSAGCSHSDKKPDAPVAPEAKAAAAKPAAEKGKAKASASAESGVKVECSVKGDDRILEVRDKGEGCELGYTKGGKEGIVASAAHGKEYCEKAFDKLQEKLKGAGYECR
jgi:hypothetical protein